MSQRSLKIRRNYHDRERLMTDPGEGDRTKQSFKEECDINNILKRYNKTGVLPDMIKSDPKYGDFSEGASYQDAMNLVLFAEEQFQALPSAVRKRFDNEPQKFFEFANDPKNLPEMVKMGLASEKPKDVSVEALKEIATNTRRPKEKAPKTPENGDSDA